MTATILTNNGWLVDPFNLPSEAMCHKSIAHSLSLLNRYTGHTSLPLSVAEHSVQLSNAVPPELARTAILHDMSEAFCNDVPRPFKVRMPDYCLFETAVQEQIFAHYGEPIENLDALAPYDIAICVDEMQELMTWNDGPISDLFKTKGLGIVIQNWPWLTAKRKFIQRFEELFDV